MAKFSSVESIGSTKTKNGEAANSPKVYVKKNRKNRKKRPVVISFS